MSDEGTSNGEIPREELDTNSFGSGIRALALSSVSPQFYVRLLALVVLASLLLSPTLELRQPAAVSRKAEITKTIPALPEPAPKAAIESRAGRGKASHLPRRNEPVNVPDIILPDALIHTAKRGESVTSLARQYLSQTVFMTSAELESTIRQASVGKCARSLSPGDQVVIPGYETAPIVERPIPVARSYEVRAIYLTGLMAGSKHGIHLIRLWKELGGNAIVFDVKDSDGSVSVPFSHDLAPKRRHPPIQNLPKFARFLHTLNLHAIARIAVFRDEQLVQHHSQVAVSSRRSKEPWRENGKLVWADPSRPEVQEYNIALAKQVAASGIDEIQFDYVRFPAEGDQKDAQFLFQAAHPEWKRSNVISEFLSRAYAELHPLGVLVSLDVFGVMAWQRQVDLAHTGQDIASMARFCDVLSPMIYPSHFFGMDGYSRPGDAPEHFIGASMERFQEITADTKVVLRPWLQAFAWRTKTYSPGYILRQASVAKQNDGVGFLFWNARNDYSKLFIAMPEMRALPSRHFSGDQPRTKRSERPTAAATGESLPPLKSKSAVPQAITHPMVQ